MPLIQECLDTRDSCLMHDMYQDIPVSFIGLFYKIDLSLNTFGVATVSRID